LKTAFVRFSRRDAVERVAEVAVQADHVGFEKRRASERIP
jgi:hypothetical protein